MVRRIAPIAGLVLLVGLAYPYIWYWLYVRWSAPDSFFSHGFLIPLVCIWLTYRRESALEVTEAEPDFRGLLLILPALLIHGAAVYLEVYSPSGFTLPILVGGIILYCFGWPVLRILLFPVLYLFFAIPLPMNWVHATAFRLKIIAVDFSTGLAGVLGTEAREVGSKIVFNGGDHLMVGTPCSGLRSLIALTAMGVLYVVEFTKMNLKGRLILLLLIVPIAMASNILRITLLCMVAGHFGSDAASGWIHDLSGYLIYIVALVLMLAVGRLIGRYSLFFRRASCESTP